MSVAELNIKPIYTNNMYVYDLSSSDSEHCYISNILYYESDYYQNIEYYEFTIKYIGQKKIVDRRYISCQSILNEINGNNRNVFSLFFNELRPFSHEPPLYSEQFSVPIKHSKVTFIVKTNSNILPKTLTYVAFTSEMTSRI